MIEIIVELEKMWWFEQRRGERYGGMIWQVAERRLLCVNKTHRATGSCKEPLMKQTRGFELHDWKWRSRTDTHKLNCGSMSPTIAQNLGMAMRNWWWKQLKLGKPLKYGWNISQLLWGAFFFFRRIHFKVYCNSVMETLETRERGALCLDDKGDGVFFY